MPTQHVWQSDPQRATPRDLPSSVFPAMPPPAPDFTPCRVTGIDPAVASVVQRLNPQRQPNIVVVGGAVTAPNLQELARRAFQIWAVAEQQSDLNQLDLKMDSHLATNQRHRIRYHAGTPDRLPLPEATADCVVVHLDGPLSASFLKTILTECQRILRPSSNPNRRQPDATASMVAVSALLPSNRRSQRTAATADPNIPIGSRGETLQDFKPLIAALGFSLTDPAGPPQINSIPPRFVLWLTRK